MVAEPAATAVARVEACLARIAADNPALQAFITVTGEAALAAAQAADRAARDGRPAGPLRGMIVAVKDCINVAGVPCTQGSPFFAGNVPARDARVVARLRAAGAILVGKTNLHEFAFGGTSQNPFTGVCRNPYDPRRIPGGSSGGSAVAVADGMAEAALGTDTGSSIRMPAALCGVSGLRPTHGIVSTDGVFPVSPRLDTVGPMARGAADLARMLAVLAEPGARERLGLVRNPIDRLADDIAGLTIAIPDDFHFAESDPPVAAAVMDSAKVLEGLGARLIATAIPKAAEVQSKLMPLLIADAADLHRQRLVSAPERFSQGVRSRMEPGLSMDPAERAGLWRWIADWRQKALAFFGTADVLLTPTVPSVAPEAGDDAALAAVTRRLSRFAWLAPAAGLPALQLPCGFVDGLPVGLQLMSAPFTDARLLALGHRYQSVTDWHLREPPG